MRIEKFDSKKFYLISFTLLLLFLSSGFYFANIKEETKFCTQMWCLPDNEIGYEEVECNGCGITKYVFYTGILNYKQECGAKEILIYIDGNHTDTEYRISKCEGSITLGKI